MDDKWFKQQQKRVGVTAEDIAKRMGRARSNVSNIYTGKQRMSLEWARAFSDVLQVPLDEVLKRAGALNERDARTVAPGFAESDAAPWLRDGVEGERTAAAAAALGGGRPGIDVWRVEGDALGLMGYLPGDLMLVDTNQSEMCRTGDVVIAQRYDGKTGVAHCLLRRYEPPVLVAASTNPEERRVLIVDGSNILIRGKVTASWRV